MGVTALKVGEALAAAFTVTVVVALLEPAVFVALSMKLNTVSTVTVGALKVAVAVLALESVTKGPPV
jgi:hypothetical protein